MSVNRNVMGVLRVSGQGGSYYGGNEKGEGGPVDQEAACGDGFYLTRSSNKTRLIRGSREPVRG